MAKDYGFSEEEIEQLKRAMRNEKSGIKKEKMQAVYMTTQKIAQGKIALSLNRSRDFVRHWVKQYKTLGLKGFEETRGGANRRYLNDEQELFVKDIVSYSLPSDFNYNQPVWSGALIVDLIQTMYEKEDTKEGVYALMARLGVSYKKAMKIDPKKSQKVISEWKTLTKKT